MGFWEMTIVVLRSVRVALCANVGETLDPREIREGGEVR